MFRLIWNSWRFPSLNHPQSQREILRITREAAQPLYEYAFPPLEMIIDRSFLQSKVLGDLVCIVAWALELYYLLRALREGLVKRVKNDTLSKFAHPPVRTSYVLFILPSPLLCFG